MCRGYLREAVLAARRQRARDATRRTGIAALASPRAESDRVALQSVVQAVVLVEVERELRRVRRNRQSQQQGTPQYAPGAGAGIK